MNPYGSNPASTSIGKNEPNLPQSVASAVEMATGKYAIDGRGDWRGQMGEGVEGALSVALVRAARVERWDVVLVLAKELEARRLARAGVAELDIERARRRST
ncbi:MAG TPA: hypothetical protein VK540_13995 [Polyangiaceae bacterium]|nr:hypothetical protein [Polyangiaceae bacterium]